MKVGLLLCDHVEERFRYLDTAYLHMFQRLLPTIEFEPYYVIDNHFPNSVQDHAIYLCNGSRFSVYDKEDWIIRLKSFVQEIASAQKKLIGVCFGHQMIAHALGGEVRKAAEGWCVGVHTFKTLSHEKWMDPDLKTFNLLMLCQDQVVALPENSQVIASSSHCPVGMFTVNETILGIQAHPEFSKEFNKAVMISRKEKIGEAKVKSGIRSLEMELHQRTIARWIANFIHSSPVQP